MGATAPAWEGGAVAHSGDTTINLPAHPDCTVIGFSHYQTNIVPGSVDAADLETGPFTLSTKSVNYAGRLWWGTVASGTTVLNTAGTGSGNQYRNDMVGLFSGCHSTSPVGAWNFYGDTEAEFTAASATPGNLTTNGPYWTATAFAQCLGNGTISSSDGTFIEELEFRESTGRTGRGAFYVKEDVSEGTVTAPTINFGATQYDRGQVGMILLTPPDYFFGNATFDIGVTASLKQDRKQVNPQRELLWISDLAGDRSGVIT